MSIRIRTGALIAFLTVMLFAAPAAFAEDLAVVNVQQIMKDSTAAQAARQQLQAKQKQFQDEISGKEKELQKEDQELAKQRSLMDQDAFKQKIAEFQQKAAGVQKDVREKRQTFTKAYEDAIGQLHAKVTGIIADMAKEKGFKIAVPTSQILFADPALDISAEVLARLNKQMPTLTVKFQ